MSQSNRIYFLDNLRAFVVVLVIVLHGSMTYMAFAPDWWYVVDRQTSLLFTMLVLLIDVPIMPIMFFIAGYFALPSLDKRGTRGFVTEKTVRVGLPWAFGAIFLAPLTAYMTYVSRQISMGYLEFWATDFWTKLYQQSVYWYLGVLFAMFLVSLTGGGVRNIVLVIGVTSWVVLCRLTRAQLLTLREEEYVQAARSMGAPETRIAVRHLLPNALPPLIVAITLAVPTAIFTEAGLSFLGLGIDEPVPSLGKMVADSAPYVRLYWHLGLFPTIAIALAMLGFTFLGDGLRDALDPRQN